MLVFLTGACGAGKTSLANYLKETLEQSNYEIYQSDANPLPSNEEVERLYREGWSGWQRMNTRQWVDQLVQGYTDKTIIWDGQSDMNFIDESMADYLLPEYRIVLIECAPEEMFRRLIHERKQPDLANENQLSWRSYLHRQAMERNGLIIDSTGLTVDLLAARFQQLALS